jgi:ubiquinone/menaquinone biosynthesis C-methylase UbiE
MNISNVEARVDDVFALSFDDDSFDLVFMIAVTGEIPRFAAAVKEFHRVLKPDGKLAISELITDPDYQLASKLTRIITSNGYKREKSIGNFLYYTVIFSKTEG